MDMTHADAPPHSIETIVRQGLCMGCGLCQSIAGPDRIRLAMSGEGGERPVVLQPLDEPTLRLVNAVCPGLHVEGYRAEDDAPGAEVDVIWGPTRFMAVGHASDPDVRFRASSGGALSALSIHLLEQGEVDFILHVAPDPQRPLRSVSRLSYDKAQVMEACGSRYGPAAPLADFRRVLDMGRPFAFVGKACDISAIRNYGKVDERVGRLMRYALNFYCGGVSEFGKTMDYVRRIGRAEADIAHLKYRGDGCPGAMVMRTHDGEEHRFSYNEMWNDERRWQLQFRCKICPDALGELADVSIADVWPGGRPITDEIGFNGFIARTQRGRDLLDAAVRLGAVTLTEPLDYAGLELAQGSQMSKKQGLTSRYAAMRDAGLITPDAPGLRLEEAAAMIGAAEREENYRGMQARLAQGDNLEEPPTLPDEP